MRLCGLRIVFGGCSRMAWTVRQHRLYEDIQSLTCLVVVVVSWACLVKPSY